MRDANKLDINLWKGKLDVAGSDIWKTDVFNKAFCVHVKDESEEIFVDVFDLYNSSDIKKNYLGIIHNVMFAKVSRPGK